MPLSFILHHWPELEPFVPASLERVRYSRWAHFIEGHTTHPAVFDPNWVGDSLGVGRFSAAPALPDGFFAVGVHSTDFERLFVVWARDGRRFHFRDLYYAAEAGSPDLYAQVGKSLRATLDRWSNSRDPLVSNSVLLDSSGPTAAALEMALQRLAADTQAREV